MALGRKTGGRQKGTPNKSTAAIMALAQVHTAAAIAELARLAAHAESDATRVAAIKELFDPGYGKARQPITGAEDRPLVSTRLTVRFLEPRKAEAGSR